MQFLPDELYATIEKSMPIACVDFVPTRTLGGVQQVGLILRDSPYGRVWCHLGGRISLGETIRQAIERHTVDTLATTPLLESEPQPKYVYQWFPDDLAPADGTPFGRDSRKQAVGLSFVVELGGDPHPRNEALDFAYFDIAALPTPIWPGCRYLLDRLLRPHSS